MIMKNSKLLIVLLSVLLVSLSGVATAASKIKHITTKKGVECVIVDLYSGAGLSCNWEKYNYKFKLCKKESLKRRTMKDGQVLPPAKGECEKAN
jgi:hypothetical protein